MNNLTGNLIQLPDLKLDESLEVRYVQGEYSKEKEVKSNVRCAACGEFIWNVETSHGNFISKYAFKIVDPRAYVHGTPDYLKKSNVLLSCHYDCKDILKTQLENKEFIPLDVV